MGLFDDLKKKATKFVTGTEVINTRQIQNGYFYTFEYNASSFYNDTWAMKNGSFKYDQLPVIFCIGPVEGNLNCFMGLNFNHLSIMKKPFFDAMNKKYNITNEDIRHLISREDLMSIGGGVAEQGIRFYNRKNVKNPKRIINSAVPKYIKHNGQFIMTDQNEEDSRFSVDVIDKGIR